MRPRKPVLLYCPDREFLSATAFALRLHLYDVSAVNNGADATALIAGDRVAFASVILIHARQADPAGRVVHRILECASHLPILLVDCVGDLAPVRYAEMVLYGRNTSMEHILAALQVLCRRRCGPGSRSAS